VVLQLVSKNPPILLSVKVTQVSRETGLERTRLRLGGEWRGKRKFQAGSCALLKKGVDKRLPCARENKGEKYSK